MKKSELMSLLKSSGGQHIVVVADTYGFVYYPSWSFRWTGKKRMALVLRNKIAARLDVDGLIVILEYCSRHCEGDFDITVAWKHSDKARDTEYWDIPSWCDFREEPWTELAIETAGFEQIMLPVYADCLEPKQEGGAFVIRVHELPPTVDFIDAYA